MNLTCWLAERRLSALLSRGETPDESLSNHLSACAACRKAYAELSALTDSLPALATPLDAPGLESAIFTRLAQRHRNAPTKLPVGVLATGVALAAVVPLGLWMRASQSQRPAVASHATVALAPSPTLTRRIQTPRTVRLPRTPRGNGIVSLKATSRRTSSGRNGVARPTDVRREATGYPLAGGRDFQSLAARSPEPIAAISVPKTATVTTPTDDLAYVNGDGFESYARRTSALLRRDPDPILKALPEIHGGDDFVAVPLPQVAGVGNAGMGEALARYEQEKQIVDTRLQRSVTLGEKRISFGDLCEKLSKATDITFTANRAVEGEKLTIFCKDRPAREILRQITKLFGFVWERSGTDEKWTYKLTEPLKVRLLEEELRNRDRNEALLALDRELDGYKNFLGLSPDDARDRVENLPDGAEKERLKKLGGMGWGPIQLYQGLSSEERDTLLNGGRLDFGTGSQAMPENLQKGVLDSLKGHAFVQDDGLSFYGDRYNEFARNAKGKAPSDVPGATPLAGLALNRSELGEFNLMGSSGFQLGEMAGSNAIELAKGISPSAASPENARVNADKKANPAFQKPIELGDEPGASKSGEAKKKLTTADVLEAFHKTTGRDVIGDYFTRLYEPAKLWSKGKTPTFDALNRACDAMRLRWSDAEGFLTFRSTDFFNMRLKEVPNRLLDRWAAARKEKKTLTESELRELSRLTDFQLDASGMSEGARVLWGLEEWDDVKNPNLRPVWRFLDSLPAPSRAAMLSESGLRFGGLGLDAQQKFLGLLYYPGEAIRKSLEDGTADEALLARLTKATLQLTDDPARLPKGLGSPSDIGKRAWNLISRAPAEGKQTRVKVLSQTGMSSANVPE